MRAFQDILRNGYNDTLVKDRSTTGQIVVILVTSPNTVRHKERERVASCRYAFPFSFLPAFTTLYSDTSADCSRFTVPHPHASHSSPMAAHARLST